jgi:hypothetical protein
MNTTMPNQVKEIEIEVGATVKIFDLNIKLSSINLLPSDYTKELKKSEAYLEVEKNGQTIKQEVGGYYERAFHMHGYMISLLSSTKTSVRLGIKLSRLILDASDFEKKMDSYEVHLDQPIVIKDIQLIIKSFYWDDSQKMIILRFTVKYKDKTKEYWDSGPMNFLDYIFESSESIDGYKVTVRPLKVNDQFKLELNESVNFRHENVSISLQELADKGGYIQMKFHLKKDTIEKNSEFILNYLQDEIDWSKVPAEKRPAPKDKIFTIEKSVTSIKFEKYLFENIRHFSVLNSNTTNIFKLTDAKN